MTDQFDIFKIVKDYETDPPQEMMQRIFKQLDDEVELQKNAEIPGHLEQLQELEVNPPPHAFMFIKNKIDHSYKLSFLQNFEIAPPSWLYAAIIDTIKPREELRSLSNREVIKTIYRYRSVAAVILLVMSGWFIYRIAGSPRNAETALVKPSVLTPNINATVANADSSSKNTAENSITSNMIRIVSGDYNRLSVDEYMFPIVNNDILSTFSSFTYDKVPAFICNDNANRFVVKLDHFTAISVSGEMSRMISGMNSFRKSGKLTHRAKRKRMQLEKWKKRDVSRFDKSLKNNPVDPIDLADFIFK